MLPEFQRRIIDWLGIGQVDRVEGFVTALVDGRAAVLPAAARRARLRPLGEPGSIGVEVADGATHTHVVLKNRPRLGEPPRDDAIPVESGARYHLAIECASTSAQQKLWVFEYDADRRIVAKECPPNESGYALRWRISEAANRIALGFQCFENGEIRIARIIVERESDAEQAPNGAIEFDGEKLELPLSCKGGLERVSAHLDEYRRTNDEGAYVYMRKRPRLKPRPEGPHLRVSPRTWYRLVLDEETLVAASDIWLFEYDDAVQTRNLHAKLDGAEYLWQTAAATTCLVPSFLFESGKTFRSPNLTVTTVPGVARETVVVNFGEDDIPLPIASACLLLETATEEGFIQLIQPVQVPSATVFLRPDAAFTQVPQQGYLPVRGGDWYRLDVSWDRDPPDSKLLVYEYDAHERTAFSEVEEMDGGFGFVWRTSPKTDRFSLAIRLPGSTRFRIRSVSLRHLGASSTELSNLIRRVPAIVLGERLELPFEPMRRRWPVRPCSPSSPIAIESPQDLYMAWPPATTFEAGPVRSAFPVQSGMQYAIHVKFDGAPRDRMRLFVAYHRAGARLGHQVTVLNVGDSIVRTIPPPTADSIMLAFRGVGEAELQVDHLSIEEYPGVLSEDADDRDRRVVMIVLNEIVQDNRVIKTAETLRDAGYDVTLIGMSRTLDGKRRMQTISGMQAYILPNPRSFLPNSEAPQVLRWQYSLAYLKTAIWPLLEEILPRFLHTHDYNTVSIGHELARRVRARGRRMFWIHDFHELAAGFDNIDAEWRECMLQHERESIHEMDCRFTVSPTIADELARRYHFSPRPAVVLNAPSRRKMATDIGRTIRGDLGLDESISLVVYTGGITELRGVHTVVEALRPENDWHFAMVTQNKGPYAKRLVDIATGAGCLDRLHFVPYVAPHEVSAYVRDASVAIHPMIRYGNSVVALPNKLFDYLYAEIPIVVSNCDLMKEFVEGWKIGEVFEAEDAESCADKIAAAISNRETYARNIRENEHLLAAVSWEEQEKKILHAYQLLGFALDAPTELLPEDLQVAPWKT